MWKRRLRIQSENASNVFRPHYAEEMWKRRLQSKNALDVFRPHYAEGIWKRRLHSENASDVFRPHYAEEMWNRGLQSENASGCFPSTLGRTNWKTQQWEVTLDLCLKKTRAGKSYHDVIVFEKLHFQNVFRRHCRAKSAFSNSTVWRSFLKSRVFVTD